MICASFASLGRNFGRATFSGVNRAHCIHNKLELFWPIHNRMKNVQIENLDWEQCIRDFDSEDTVFYIDPPYMYSDAGIYDEAWNLEKHKHLLRVIRETKGFVALSGYANELYDAEKWDKRITWDTRITVASKAHTKTNNLADKEGMMSKEAVECLWLKE
jgi:DNA adenine methylase